MMTGSNQHEGLTRINPMMRYLTALLSACLLVGSAGAADAKKVTLRWHGQSFFDLETSQGTRIAFDPHAIDAYGRIIVRADLVLVSHNHNDHNQVDVIESKNKKTISGLREEGRKFEWNLVDEKFRDVHLRSVGTYHDDAQGIERGKNTVFILEVDGLRIVHLGDLGHFLTEEQIKQIGQVDVLMIPVGGVYTLNGSDAKKVVTQLKPRKYIIPMHYGTKAFDDLLPVNEFLEDQPKANVKTFPLTNKLVIEADFAPAEPIVAVLNWK
jgi:L-ascorbate metabolism protein UlaG (beta-lactamase superfamily)